MSGGDKALKTRAIRVIRVGGIYVTRGRDKVVLVERIFDVTDDDHENYPVEGVVAPLKDFLEVGKQAFFGGRTYHEEFTMAGDYYTAGDEWEEHPFDFVEEVVPEDENKSIDPEDEPFMAGGE